MNSEGYSVLPQKVHLSKIQQSGKKHCRILQSYGRAINYLANTAPVDVIVVQGNHDYERMFYAGEYLRAFFKNDERVEL